MEVIFIKDLRNQGKKGDIKKVKDGYAENFLIKNGYAVIKNKENLKKLEKEKAKKKEEETIKKETAEKLKKKLDKEVLEFKVKTGAGDKVFGSISSKQIKDALKEKKYDIEKNQIDLKKALSSLGFHDVDINLYPKIKATIKVHIIK
ncbi:MAG: 50S ribosomal protein L9 [Bacilli bacterium]|nr:50S ribosomal protein L9 [Bacilli bacterium]MBR3049272.1 50S ribosomal protein L9 [Bacilli bacterium]